MVLHAIIDALIGGAGLGDIGTLYPDSIPVGKGPTACASWNIRPETDLPPMGGPKCGCDPIGRSPSDRSLQEPHARETARALRNHVDDVNVKAKTNEGMGFVGRREGLSALAVCGLASPPRGKNDGARNPFPQYVDGERRPLYASETGLVKMYVCGSRLTTNVIWDTPVVMSRLILFAGR